jgi:hypothetical protein
MQYWMTVLYSGQEPDNAEKEDREGPQSAWKGRQKGVHKGATEIGVDNAVDWSGRDGQEPSCSAHV